MDNEIKTLLIQSDSILSLLECRGYIDHTKNGCPNSNEINQIIGKLRNSYEKRK
jgi:hypothetical protein